MINEDSTICAIATPSGGALGIVRISGSQSIDIADSIFKPIGKGGPRLSQKEGNTLSYGQVVDEKGNVVDEVVASIYRAPHSYTGENCIEFSCHGSSYIMHEILLLLIRKGCRLASPGEYTERAFLNGKMDLSQAEAVADLIASNSANSHRIALKQMRGNYSSELQSLRKKLLHITSLLELELDFSDHEDLEFANRKDLEDLSIEVQDRVVQLCNSFKIGNVMKHGIPVAIIGETNAGKSTLLNALLGEKKAIVSDISGTTRDAIEGTTTINGTIFRFIDTAGIRETQDSIEHLGIELSFSKIEEASVVLWMIDIENAEKQYKVLAPKIYSHINKEQRLFIILNKKDKYNSQELHSRINRIKEIIPDFQMVISANDVNDVEQIRALLASNFQPIENSDIIVSNGRHYEALQKAQTAIARVHQGLQSSLPGDLISQDLRECIYHISEITGEITSQDVLESIFKDFCVGK